MKLYGGGGGGKQDERVKSLHRLLVRFAANASFNLITSLPRDRLERYRDITNERELSVSIGEFSALACRVFRAIASGIAVTAAVAAAAEARLSFRFVSH